MRYARELATTRLAGDPAMVGRSELAAAQTQRAARTLGRPRPELLISAAWLHGIGLAPEADKTGFVPVDGGLELLSLGWPGPVVSLVAHQAQARLIAKYATTGHELSLFSRIQGWPADILDYSILTAGPDGIRSVSDGLEEIRAEQQSDPRIPEKVAAERLARLERAGMRVAKALGSP